MSFSFSFKHLLSDIHSSLKSWSFAKALSLSSDHSKKQGIRFQSRVESSMGPESNSAPACSSSASSSPSAKRNRDPEDEVYIDNLRSHKRYLSEIMASSLNGLTVGDPISVPENLLESPARSEAMLLCNSRDEINWHDSPMLEDLDDVATNPSPSASQAEISAPSSPVSPYRYQPYQKPVSCSYPRQRGSESEGRFPSSPSDICHSADLRRAALLRSVHMRTHPLGPSPFELSLGRDSMDAEIECSSMARDKLNMDVKDEDEDDEDEDSDD